MSLLLAHFLNGLASSDGAEFKGQQREKSERQQRFLSPSPKSLLFMTWKLFPRPVHNDLSNTHKDFGASSYVQISGIRFQVINSLLLNLAISEPSWKFMKISGSLERFVIVESRWKGYIISKTIMMCVCVNMCQDVW